MAITPVHVVWVAATALVVGLLVFIGLRLVALMPKGPPESKAAVPTPPAFLSTQTPTFYSFTYLSISHFLYYPLFLINILSLTNFVFLSPFSPHTTYTPSQKGKEVVDDIDYMAEYGRAWCIQQLGTYTYMHARAHHPHTRAHTGMA
jgi:hypothetical protein